MSISACVTAKSLKWDSIQRKYRGKRADRFLTETSFYSDVSWYRLKIDSVDALNLLRTICVTKLMCWKTPLQVKTCNLNVLNYEESLSSCNAALKGPSTQFVLEYFMKHELCSILQISRVDICLARNDWKSTGPGRVYVKRRTAYDPSKG